MHGRVGFKKCDLLYIINNDDRDWWLARSKDTGKERYIRSNYVAKVNSLDIHKFICSRRIINFSQAAYITHVVRFISM